MNDRRRPASGTGARLLRHAVALALALAAAGCSEARRTTDPDFILLANTPSPDGRFRLLVYQYDIGALGYSREFWAVTPPRFEGMDLAPCELPDGYAAEGWSPAGTLMVRTWTPYDGFERTRTLSTGEVFRGVPIEVIGALDTGAAGAAR